MCWTSPGPDPDHQDRDQKMKLTRDRDRNKNVQLFNIENSLIFQIKFFVHPKSNYYSNINIW